MRLTVDNARELGEALQEIEDFSEVKDAADGYVDLDGDNTTEAREQRAEYRETWEDNIGGLEDAAISLVTLFGYAAVPRNKARKAGLVAQSSSP